MSRVILTRLAQSDFKDIGRFISQRNEPAAKKWVRKLRTTCKTTIASFPHCGTQFDHLLSGMRAFSVGHPVEILRVVHGAMDYNQLKFTE
jgi:plasmid stabilization system protein ParE